MPNWTQPKPLIKIGYKTDPLSYTANGSLYACTDYKTGKTLYYRIDYYCSNKHEILYFDTFEKAMMFADLHSIKLDTYAWDTYGIIRYYSINDEIGTKKTFSDGTTKVLEGLDD